MPQRKPRRALLASIELAKIVHAVRVVLRSAAVCCSVIGICTSASAAGSFALDLHNPHGEAADCWLAGALRARIEHYAATLEPTAEDVHLVLDIEHGAVLLSIVRAEVVLSRRRFTKLPQSCADRRDAVALSIALALEMALQPETQAAHEEQASRSVSRSHDQSVSDRSADERTSAPDAERQRSATDGEPARESAAGHASSNEPTEPGAATHRAAPPRPRLATAEREPDAPSSSAMPDAGHGTALEVVLHGGARWLMEAAPAAVLTGVMGLDLSLSPDWSIVVSALVSRRGESDFVGASAQTRLYAAQLLGCHVRRLTDFAVQACVGPIAGACRASGRDYARDLPDANLAWVATMARLSLRWPAEQTVSLRMALDGHVNVVRPTLRVDGSDARLHPAWVGGALGLEVLVALP